MSLEAGECIYIRDSEKATVELIPARILWAEGGQVVVELEAERFAGEAETDVLIYYTLNRTFMQQAAAVECSGSESLQLISDVEHGSDPERMDVTPDCELLLLSISPQGMPVSAENRECFRTRNRSDIYLTVNDDSNCRLSDISQTGLAAVCDEVLEVGDIVQVLMKRENVQVSGPARVQSKRRMRNGQFRYGLLCVERAMQNACGRVAMIVQREELRRRTQMCRS